MEILVTFQPFSYIRGWTPMAQRLNAPVSNQKRIQLSGARIQHHEGNSVLNIVRAEFSGMER